jgi:hypothetical protein
MKNPTDACLWSPLLGRWDFEGVCQSHTRSFVVRIGGGRKRREEDRWSGTKATGEPNEMI